MSPNHIHGTLYGPKATIKNAVKTVKSGGTLHIAPGIYKEHNITINKNMYIRGAKQSNTIIKGNYNGPIFQISNRVKVSIHNLAFINVNSDSAAIKNHAYLGNLYIDRCSFTNNTEAIENSGDAGYVTVKDTIFKNNIISIENSVGYKMHLTNCTITNSKVKKRYYPIVNGGVLYVDMCKFTNNPTITISNDFGASIIATRSIFTNNTLAIINEGGLNVNGCIFTKNTNGSIWNSRIATVTNSKFIGNNAINGGAINNYGEVALTVINSTFTNNTAAENGGAIQSAADSILKVSNSTFNNNIAKENGGAIYCDNDVLILNVTSCNFSSNTAMGLGGAIYTYSGTVNFNRLTGNKNYDLYNNGINSLDARYNWWGSNNPDFSNRVSGAVNTTPWMVLTINANPTTINNGGNSTIVADLLHDSNGAYHSPSLTHLPDGIRVSFSTDGKGSVNPKVPVNGTVAGKATTTFTAGIPGISSIAATVDNQKVTTQVNILPVALAPTSSDPVNNSVKVPTNQIIKIAFNIPIKFSTNPWFELKYTNNGTTVPFTKSIHGNILSIMPNSLLSYGKQYIVVLHSNSITDLSNNPYASPYTIKFTTNTPPIVTSTYPVRNAGNVTLNSVIKIKFNMAIKLANNPYITLKNSSGKTKAVTLRVNGSTLYITPKTPLAKGTIYTVLLHTNSVTDSTGTARIEKPYSTKFKTKA